MTKDDIQLLFEYDRWANNRVLQAVSPLSEEQFIRDLRGSFCSVRDTLIHIIAGEWLWLSYWKAPSHSPEVIAELRAQRDTHIHPNRLPDIASVRLKWAEVEKEQLEFVSRVTDEGLKTRLPARGTSLELVHLMQHMANHSTYHRGQIALMLRQLNAEPLATDFHVFLAEGRQATPVY
jgi:uncharacterized damage-inducible protein DinB